MEKDKHYFYVLYAATVLCTAGTRRMGTAPAAPMKERGQIHEEQASGDARLPESVPHEKRGHESGIPI